MPVNECIPVYEEADRITGQCSADVVGKTFVAISGNMQADRRATVATAGAGVRALGVAAYSQVSGSDVPIICGNQIVPITTGAGITAGQSIECDASGLAIPHVSGVVLGVAMTAQASTGQDVIVKLNL